MSQSKAHVQRFCLIAFTITITASSAAAGQRAFVWTRDTAALPEGLLEIEQWLWSTVAYPTASGSRPASNSTMWIWFAPVYGLTEDIELAVPWEILATRQGTRITNVTLETRIRLYDRLDDSALFRSMIRLFYQHNLNHPMNGGRWMVPWAGGDVTISVGDPAGSHLALSAGATTDFRFGNKQRVTQTLGLGYTQQLSDRVRLGVEYGHELFLGKINEDGRSHFVGPSLAFARHRFWTTIGVVFGLTAQQPRVLTRLMFGVAI